MIRIASWGMVMLALGCGARSGVRSDASDGGTGPDSAAPIVYPERFACAGADWPEPTEETARFDLTLTEQSLARRDFTLDPIEGATVRGCRWEDPDCTSPLFTGTTDEHGRGPFYMPIDTPPFLVFFPIEHVGYPQHDWFVSFPIVKSFGWNWTMGHRAAVSAGAGFHEIEIDPEAASVIVGSVVDCVRDGEGGDAVEGARITIEGHAGRVWYTGGLDGITPSPGMTETGPLGLFYTFNVEPGEHVLRATLRDGTPIAAMRVRAVPGHHVGVSVYPTPHGQLTPLH